MAKNMASSFNFCANNIVQMITNIAFYEFISLQSYTIHPVDSYSLLFIDYGKLSVCMQGETFHLKEGHVFLMPPQTEYTFETKESAVNVLLIRFVSDNSALLTLLINQTIALAVSHRNLFAHIMTEAKSTFPQVATNVFQTTERNRMKDSPIGAETLIYTYLAQLIVFMARTQQSLDNEPVQSSTSTSLIKKHFEKKEIDDIIGYMEENLDKNFSIAELSEHLFVSPSYLKKNFKKETGYSVIHFYRVLKMERAKQWIRENQMNFTEVACRLGYDTLHHFSNSFKKYTGLSPTAYKHSIHTIESKLEDLT